jgi:hypothetical protein
VNTAKKLGDEVARWPEVSVSYHRFGGLEFRIARAELGHIHEDGTVDIPFSRAIHDVLLAEGLASEHHWVPDSGWVTFDIRNGADLQHALWLMRLSYVRHAMKTAAHPEQFLEQESKALKPSPELMSLLEKLSAREPMLRSPTRWTL